MSKSILFVSRWVAKNYGRRFWGCVNYNIEIKEGECGFFMWYDSEYTKRLKKMIKFLLTEKYVLEVNLKEGSGMDFYVSR